MSSDLITIFINVALGFGAGVLGVFVTVGQYKNKVDSLEKDTGELKRDTKELIQKLTETRTMLDERTQSYASGLTKRKSPVNLTDKGSNLLKASGADAFVLENQAELIAKIQEMKPQTAYDVQEMAKSVVESLKDNERYKKFKDYVYREGLELNVIFIVMSIYLRDIALPQLGYTLEQVDASEEITKTSL